MTTAAFEKKREKYLALRVQLLGAIQVEQDEKRLKRLRREFDRCIKVENKKGLSVLTIMLLLQIVMKVVEWWLNTRKEGDL